MVELFLARPCRMEDTLSDIRSRKLEKKSYKNIFTALDDAVEIAKEARDLKLVDNPALRKALNIVEEFLRKSGRICYGGMAINAHLPTTTKFYDFSKTLPDYDFFTPNPDKDVQELVRLLKGSGFDDVSARVGMHEGTTKVFVNYTGVADITFLPQWLYSKLKKKAIHEDGITYADADFLRMNMYLELSRPHGEVERWEKVYKRLVLLNMVKESHVKKCKNKDGRITVVDRDMRDAVLDYIIKNNMIYVGADLKGIYEHYNKDPSKAILNSTSPVIVFVENPELHFSILRQIVQDIDPRAKLEVQNWPSYQEITPEMYGILLNGKIIALLIGEHYCYAYNTIQITNHRHIRIAALDTAITLFYQLSFVDGLEGIVPKSTHCFADTLVEISMKTRDKGVESQFPPFVTSCVGHQPSKASLLRKKIERIRLKKTQKNRSGMRYNRTIKQKNK
jgi:hypothetical protein